MALRNGASACGLTTQGLTLALTAQAAKPGTLCAMPAWTFVASAHAAVNAGLIPYFVDVDIETWALDPAGLAEHIAQAPAPVGAVMPVAPFGEPISVAPWDAFRADTGLPVVIDAAAGFELTHWDGRAWTIQDTGIRTRFVSAWPHGVWAAGDLNKVVTLRR